MLSHSVEGQAIMPGKHGSKRSYLRLQEFAPVGHTHWQIRKSRLEPEDAITWKACPMSKTIHNIPKQSDQPGATSSCL